MKRPHTPKHTHTNRDRVVLLRVKPARTVYWFRPKWDKVMLFGFWILHINFECKKDEEEKNEKQYSNICFVWFTNHVEVPDERERCDGCAKCSKKLCIRSSWMARYSVYVVAIVRTDFANVIFIFMVKFLCVCCLESDGRTKWRRKGAKTGERGGGD